MKKLIYPPQEEITKIGGNLNKAESVFFDLEDCIFAVFSNG